MPYNTLEEAKGAKFPIVIDEIGLGLNQVNKLAEIFDAIKKDEKVENPMAVAIDKWKEIYAELNGKWVQKEKHKDEFKANTFEITKDIFSVGKWNGMEFTDEDLESLVKNFNAGKVPFKIDLFKNAKSEDERHGGMPAIGWLQEVKKVGKKLFARITDIPKRIKELIENKAYKQVSIEMRRVLKDKNFENILTGVALLGVEMAGVENLDEFGQFYEYQKDEDIETFAYEVAEQNKKGDIEMEAKIKELEAKLAEKEAENLKFKEEGEAKEKELADIKAKEVEARAEVRKSEIKKFIADKKAEGKLLPKHEEMVEKVMENLSSEVVVKFKQGDKEEEVGITKMFEMMIDSMPNLVKFEEMSQTGNNQDDFADFKFVEGNGSENSQKLNFIAQKIKAEKKISYEEALVEANKKNPELVEK